MNGPEHYREAEKLLGGKPITDDQQAEYVMGPGFWPPSLMELHAAQVHATLALAAAIGTMGSLEEGGATRGSADDKAWRAVAGESE